MLEVCVVILSILRDIRRIGFPCAYCEISRALDCYLQVARTVQACRESEVLCLSVVRASVCIADASVVGWRYGYLIIVYWESLDNYALGATPCVLRMSAVENGNVTYTLNKTEANATLASAQIIESSGNSPKQPEYANPTISYFGYFSVCSNYEMK